MFMSVRRQKRVSDAVEVALGFETLPPRVMADSWGVCIGNFIPPKNSRVCPKSPDFVTVLRQSPRNRSHALDTFVP